MACGMFVLASIGPSFGDTDVPICHAKCFLMSSASKRLWLQRLSAYGPLQPQEPYKHAIVLWTRARGGLRAMSLAASLLYALLASSARGATISPIVPRKDLFLPAGWVFQLVVVQFYNSMYIFTWQL